LRRRSGVPSRSRADADRKLINEGIPAAQHHAGTRLSFGPDGKLHVTTGDDAERQLAHRLDSLACTTAY
jgi:glucose/arabinose dehydrogenase